MILLSHEQKSLDEFRHNTRGAQEQILSAAMHDPKTSGVLIAAYRDEMFAAQWTRDTLKREGIQ